MGEKIKGLKTWIKGIVTSVIIAVISSIITSSVKKISFVDSFLWLVETVKDFLVSILTYKVEIYKILLCVLLVCFVIFIIIKILQSKDSTEKYKTYTQAIYKDWHIKWRYIKDWQSIRIKGIQPYCSCGCDLTSYTTESSHYPYKKHTRLKCPNCEKTYPLLTEDNITDIEILIVYFIKRNEYPENISAK